MTKKINYTCSLDNSILEKVKKNTNVVYKKGEIIYTVLHVMQSCTKKANVMYTGQGNKEQVSQDLKSRFLIFLLILLIKDGFFTDLLINRLLMLILSFYLMYYDFLLYIFLCS